MRVAVYGSLRSGLYNSGLLSGSTLLGVDTLGGWGMYSLGAFPTVIPGSGKILVEVYLVDHDTLGRLDSLEGWWGDLSDRNYYERLVVRTRFGKAYIYSRDVANKALDKVVAKGNVADWSLNNDHT